MWAVWNTSHVNTLSRSSLILVLRSFWVNYSAELLVEMNVQINMQEPGTSPFKCHWRNYVAINCTQDRLLIYPVVLIVLWRCIFLIANNEIFSYMVCVYLFWVRQEGSWAKWTWQALDSYITNILCVWERLGLPCCACKVVTSESLIPLCLTFQIKGVSRFAASTALRSCSQYIKHRSSGKHYG